MLKTCWAASLVMLLCFGSIAVHADEPVILSRVSDAFATPEQAALARTLGKALYWDDQIGSGNGAQMACASCHYQAGADSHPLRVAAGTFEVPGQQAFDGSPRIIRGSVGVKAADFVAIALDESGVASPQEAFTITGDWHVTDKNAPAAVDSDSIHNFCDGRANTTFNGGDITGTPLPCFTNDGGTRVVLINRASQASQAVGPCLSPVEMSSTGRTFPELGYKMMNSVPLVNSSGDVCDVVDGLGYGGVGGYKQMIIDVFSGGPLEIFIGDQLTTQEVRLTQGGDVYTEQASVTDCNFALFFGVAVAFYEQSLTTQPKALPNRAQKRAFKEMRCDKCHYEDGRSHAVIDDVGNRPFAATGVEPLASGPGVTVPALNLLSPTPNDEADADEGQFKSNHMFNLTLTAPFFHDGSAETIEDMLDFYVRGGDFNQDNVNSHVRQLDVTQREYDLVVTMLKNLTDPRIEEGVYPFAHPSLNIPLPNGDVLRLRSSDEGAGGLAYELNGEALPPVGGETPATPETPAAPEAPAAPEDEEEEEEEEEVEEAPATTPRGSTRASRAADRVQRSTERVNRSVNRSVGRSRR